MSPLAMLLAIAGIVLVVMIYYYQSFTGKRDLAEHAFVGIDAILSKRCDLVPNLIATVNQYKHQESLLLDRIAELRVRAADPAVDPDKRVGANQELGRELRAFMLRLAKLPGIRTNDTFLRLHNSLGRIDEQLAASRRSFNDTVNAYNSAIEAFPGSLVATLFGFQRRSLLDVEGEERHNPEAAARSTSS